MLTHNAIELNMLTHTDTRVDLYCIAGKTTKLNKIAKDLLTPEGYILYVTMLTHTGTN